MNMTVKTTIKKILDARKISRYQLAKELGITPQALEYMLQNNSRGVRVSVLIKLQEVSGLTVSQFWKLLKDEHGLDG
jgi:DNA-binding Xre family transcriptional regulator